MRLRTERKHGLHECTNNKFYIQHFYTSLPGTSPVKGWSPDVEHRNTKYPLGLDGPQHNCQQQYRNDWALYLLKTCETDGWLDCRRPN